MTTTTTAPTSPASPTSPSAPAAAPPYRLTPRRVLRSEWHKLWTLRSTWITLLSSSLMILGIGLTMGITYEAGGDDADMDVVVIVLIGMQLSQIAVAVLGILCTAGEYANGMVRASMTAVPRRLPVLWAKAAAYTAATFLTTLGTVFATFLGAQVFLGDTEQAASLGDPGILRALVGSAAAMALLGLTALALGALLRSVPGAIGAFIGGVLLLPEVVSALPFDAVSDALRYFPTKVLQPIGSAQPVEDAVSPGVGLLALTLWALALLGLASLRLKRRDV
ncbi:ABC transporter permease [Streptomyces sp. NPDC050504]|uniref:ABC transporter permease n=1 Tax=Streptomyces sp. NPDC050504 TaxID=3365618 RepID=UPI0037BCBDA1